LTIVAFRTDDDTYLYSGVVGGTAQIVKN